MMSGEEDDNSSCSSASNESIGVGSLRPRWIKLPSDDTEYSDWQIDIRFEESSAITSYLVHRYTIGLQSTYFRAIFSDNNAFVESKAKCSSIAGNEFEVKHFELFLDFLYRWDHKKDSVDPGGWYHQDGSKHQWVLDEILPMLYFADYFGVRELRKKAMLSLDKVYKVPSNKERYKWLQSAYCFADSLSMNDFKRKIETICYNNWRDFRGCWDLMPTSHLKRDLFRAIRRARGKAIRKGPDYYGTNHGAHQAIKYVMKHNPELIDIRIFLEIQADLLLAEKSLGNTFWIPSGYAANFLKHEQFLGLDAPETDALTPLQEQCIKWLPYEFETKTLIPDEISELKPAMKREVDTYLEKKPIAKIKIRKSSDGITWIKNF